MKITMIVEVEVGAQFTSREDIIEQIQQALDDANPGTVMGGKDGDREFDIESWDVVEQAEKKVEAPKGIAL